MRGKLIKYSSNGIASVPSQIHIQRRREIRDKRQFYKGFCVRFGIFFIT